MALESYGNITKEEQLKSVTEGIIPNTFVMESQDPFPGYYGALPSDKVPESFFLIMSQKESTERILRLTHIIRNNSNIEFEGSPVRIDIYNDTFFGVRIRGLADFSRLEEIQHYYRDNGLVFMKKRNVDATGLIQIKKIFRIKQVREGVYQEIDDGMYYVEINKQLTWSNFKTITRKVKNNLEMATFDAALATIYGVEVLDLVRIYSKDISDKNLNEIHKKYREVITKMI